MFPLKKPTPDFEAFEEIAIGKRKWVEENEGAITSREDFETFP